MSTRIVRKSTFGLALAALASLAATAEASHPHQAICTVSGKAADGSDVAFVLQIESAREYVNGDSSKDVHDFRYQARICDDDNDDASCSTYESAAVTHAPGDEVTLVGLADKSAVLFRGKITGTAIEGKLKTGTLTPFKAKLTGCIGQTWVKLEPEATSHVH